MLCKILVFGKMLGLITCEGCGPDSQLTCRGSAQSSISPERKLEEVEGGRVVGKEGVQVPGEGVLLTKGVVYDMAQDGVNTFGQGFIFSQANCEMSVCDDYLDNKR